MSRNGMLSYGSEDSMVNLCGDHLNLEGCRRCLHGLS